MCVDPVPLILPTPPTVSSTSTSGFTSQPILATMATATTTASPFPHRASKPASDSGEMDMGTSPPSLAVIFWSPPGPIGNSFQFPHAHQSMDWTPSAKAPGSISPRAFTGSAPTSIFTPPFGSGIMPQPIFGAPQGQQLRATFGRPPVFPITVPVAPFPPAGSILAHPASKAASDPEPMDTTPPSQAVIHLQSPPSSWKNMLPLLNALPAPASTLQNVSTASSQVSTGLTLQPASAPAATYTFPFAPGAAPQPTFGVSVGQQLGATSFGPSSSLANLAAPPQAAGVSSPAAQPPSGSITKPVFSELTPPRFTFGIPVSAKRAFGNNTGAAAYATNLTPGFATATGMPSTGDSSSLGAKTDRGTLVFTGPAALKGMTGCGVSVPAPGPSSMSGALTFGQGPSGRASITSLPQTPAIQGMPSARAVGTQDTASWQGRKKTHSKSTHHLMSLLNGLSISGKKL
ncbi:nuclear pore-associated protein 1-like [Tamandua tetradactyla]|uniref:nuclear pore-associated protein 1-like n=1 Tax=Tamandua tetradactyla TaxID=48850 RepID=UPI0040545F37